MSKVVLTEQNFDSVVEAHSLVVVDFWAKWCGPCKSFMNVIDTLVSQYPEVVFATVDIDVEKKLAEEFQIRSIPAVMILRDRVMIYAESGAHTLDVMTELLDQAQVPQS